MDQVTDIKSLDWLFEMKFRGPRRTNCPGGGWGPKWLDVLSRAFPGDLYLGKCRSKDAPYQFQMKFEGGGALRTQGGEMKLDPDLHPEKKVFPWE